MILTLLTLSREDIKLLNITDVYSIHKIVYGLFEDIRNEKEKINTNSGFLYVDKDGDNNGRKILILSNRSLKEPICGQIKVRELSDSFLLHDRYGFEVIVNPVKREKTSGKIIAIKEKEQISKWFVDKSDTSWGFIVIPETLQVTRMSSVFFSKKGNDVRLNRAYLTGQLIVTDRNKFINSFKKGIGRAKAFGFGLLQIIPLLNN